MTWPYNNVCRCMIHFSDVLKGHATKMRHQEASSRPTALHACVLNVLGCRELHQSLPRCQLQHLTDLIHSQVSSSALPCLPLFPTPTHLSKSAAKMQAVCQQRVVRSAPSAPSRPARRSMVTVRATAGAAAGRRVIQGPAALAPHTRFFRCIPSDPPPMCKQMVHGASSAHLTLYGGHQALQREGGGRHGYGCVCVPTG